MADKKWSSPIRRSLIQIKNEMKDYKVPLGISRGRNETWPPIIDIDDWRQGIPYVDSSRIMLDYIMSTEHASGAYAPTWNFSVPTSNPRAGPGLHAAIYDYIHLTIRRARQLARAVVQKISPALSLERTLDNLVRLECLDANLLHLILELYHLRLSSQFLGFAFASRMGWESAMTVTAIGGLSTICISKKLWRFMRKRTRTPYSTISG